MPIYEYEAADAHRSCRACREGFEIRQAMADPPLTACPECGNSVRKRISAFGVDTRPSTRSLLRDGNLEAHGFTKLVNEGGGRFRKI